MENRELNSKKEIMISIITVILLIVSVIGVTYAVFNFTGDGTVENKLIVGDVEFRYYEETNGISLVNAEPLSDAVGKVLTKTDAEKGINNGYFDFVISSAVTGMSVNYEIYAVADTSLKDAMDSQYVKVYLTNADTEEPVTGYTSVVPTFGSLPNAEHDSNGKRLYYGSFERGAGIHHFRLRIWVSEDYNIPNISKTFSIKVNVSATS